MLVYDTPNFIVESPEQPFVSREEGGHIKIRVKDESITDRTRLTPSLAKEFMKLSMVAGEALEKAMNNRGVKVVKVNYQDMGNWAYKQGKTSYLHYHIFGRVLGASNQPYPESVYLPDRSSGFYDSFVPLNTEDVAEIRSQIGQISKEARYSNELW